MSKDTNMKSNQNFNDDRNNGSEFPRTSITSFNWKTYFWSVYQLANGVKVMTTRHIALLVGQPKHVVQKFLSDNNLETLTVLAPNGAVAQVYPLYIAAVYLQRLLDDGHLETHEKSLTRREWKELIQELCNPIPGKVMTPNSYFFNGDYRIYPAQLVRLELEDDIKLEVLVLNSGECRIEHREGLKCVKPVDINLLTIHSPSKAKLFSRLKLSPDNVECRIKTESGMRSLYALSFKDWLSVWEHLANKGNKKATAILKAWANENIYSRVAKLFPQG
jgi:hypothetical protein